MRLVASILAGCAGAFVVAAARCARGHRGALRPSPDPVVRRPPTPRRRGTPWVGARRARRCRRAADAEIPQLLDLLAAASSAGLSAPLALRRAADGLVGPLADELGRIVQAVELGGRWRDELELLAERLDLPDLRRTVGALTRTETLGASLADATSSLAAEVRTARRAETAARARTAPVKMLFPLVFLVLPAFLLLTVVPVLLTTVRSIA